jgi:hypothetical protein
MDNFSELAKCADFRGQAFEVDHFVLWRLGGHFGVFAFEREGGGEGTVGEDWKGFDGGAEAELWGECCEAGGQHLIIQEEGRGS